MSVWEDEQSLHLEADLPGCSIEDVDLVAERGRLHITYTRKAPEGERKYWLNERGYGKFERVLALPKDINPEQIEANLDSGVLHIRVGKRPELQPRKIPVQSSAPMTLEHEQQADSALG